MEIPKDKKQFEITEKFIGWGSAYVWAETAEEAKRLYEQGEYDDYEHDFDNFQELLRTLRTSPKHMFFKILKSS